MAIMLVLRQAKRADASEAAESRMARRLRRPDLPAALRSWKSTTAR